MAKLKTMVVKTTEDGQEKEITVALIGPNGHPLYEVDGKEVEQDIDDLRSILKDRNDENAKRRLENKELTERLALFADLDPEKAKEALGIVANLDAKKLVDAKDMEALKAQIEAAWVAKLDGQKAAYDTQVADLTTKVAAEQDRVRAITLKNEFFKSEYLKQTIYDPVRDDAFKLFGDRFKVEPGDNGDMRIVLENADGTPLLSTARPGQPASFDEAIEHIFSNHPQKDHLMKGGQASGSGAHGGGGGAKTTLQQLQDQLAVAQKNKDANAIVMLTDKIHEARQAGTA